MAYYQNSDDSQPHTDSDPRHTDETESHTTKSKSKQLLSKYKQLRKDEQKRRSQRKTAKDAKQARIKSLRLSLQEEKFDEQFDVITPEIVTCVTENKVHFQGSVFPLDIFKPYIYVMDRGNGKICVKIKIRKQFNKYVGWKHSTALHYATISDTNLKYSYDLLEEVKFALMVLSFDLLSMLANRKKNKTGPIQVQRYTKDRDINDELIKEYFDAWRMVWLTEFIDHPKSIII